LDHNFKHRYHAHEHDELRYGGGNWKLIKNEEPFSSSLLSLGNILALSLPRLWRRFLCLHFAMENITFRGWKQDEWTGKFHFSSLGKKSRRKINFLIQSPLKSKL
jgi:hypothetical protein